MVLVQDGFGGQKNTIHILHRESLQDGIHNSSTNPFYQIDK